MSGRGGPASGSRPAAEPTARRRRLGVTVLLALLVAAAVWLVWFSPVLTARRVAVTGAPAPLARQASAAADDELGRPLARVDTDRARRSVLAIPDVRTATVSRRFPHTLGVAVTPRVPVLAVAPPEGLLLLVDSSGLAYRGTSSPPPGIPTVRLARQVRTGDARSLRPLAVALGALSAQDRATVSDVVVAADGSIGFRLGEIQVDWGGPVEPQRKARALVLVRRVAQAQAEVTRIDVSDPGRPVVS